MKKVLAAIILVGVVGSAFASCPPGSPYRCVPGWNGKMICGCG